ncbi:hypothetical protein VJ923_11470 [Adlercreutzia sp. R25]|uniref:Uncharacterized protein n=1 Tax=Adlercreutzia shanghongiae TaxID=3111773 RepID=A0ABU6J2A2_9ACTN|nr:MULTISPECIES: hypothetical protein [unclassified Adlercreutzia]MEC4273776.1 hypothetical protein [Adlercreutzia sp. R25]MEC4295854.1 hypothetical protein [Adlercreutzia sp. R22]
MKKTVDRREFLAVGTTAALMGAAALTGCAAPAASDEAPSGEDLAATGTEKPGAEMREVTVTAAGDVVNTNAADRLQSTYEGDLKDYFKGRDFVHQIGFYAPDWKAFAQNHHDLFGSGPFYHTTNTFGRLIYRGEEVDCSDLKFEACYGGWGSHTIEVVQQVGDAPTMFTEYNDMEAMGLNHVHVFVEDMEQALEACEVLDIPVITIGYSDLEKSLEKARAAGADEEEVRARASKPAFVVIDMREQFGAMVQLVTEGATAFHDLVIGSMVDWDGETDLFREIGA